MTPNLDATLEVADSLVPEDVINLVSDSDDALDLNEDELAPDAP